MEILNDILKAQQEQKAEIQALKQVITGLGTEIKKSTPMVNLDAKAVSNNILTQLLPRTDVFIEQTKKLEQVAQSLPQQITEKKVWGISLSTKLWLLALVAAVLIGFYFGPPVVQTYQYQYIKSQLEKREAQVEQFRQSNPKTAAKYFD